jgi:response regulator RpfG family c-di-GMP phosphodiesterase
LLKKLGMDKAYQDLMLKAAPMHDIGKIGIPDYILLKPGKLTPEEMDNMRRHPLIGSKILAGSDAPVIRLGEEIARTHHEKYDGSGYPNGLKEKIFRCQAALWRSPMFLMLYPVRGRISPPGQWKKPGHFKKCR